MAITHHELCFGCGVANLFGLQMEVEPAEEREGVSGRFFLKQDHQGPPGHAHGGVLACALDEVMALCVHAQGRLAVTRRLEVEFRAPAPVGTFVRIDARVARSEGRTLELTASAREVGGERTVFADASGVFALLEGTEAPPGAPS